MLTTRDNFETLTEAKIAETKAALVKVPANEVHRVAKLQGLHEGLELSLQFYRDAARRDADPHGDGT